jgi:hypothetical protein
LLYKTSQNFHTKKNDTGYLLWIFRIFKLLSTTEQLPALVILVFSFFSFYFTFLARKLFILVRIASTAHVQCHCTQNAFD